MNRFNRYCQCIKIAHIIPFNLGSFGPNLFNLTIDAIPLKESIAYVRMVLTYIPNERTLHRQEKGYIFTAPFTPTIERMPYEVKL